MSLAVKGHAEDRLNTLCGLIVGQINSKSSSIPGLSKGLCKNNNTALSFCITMNFGEKKEDNPLKDRIKRMNKNDYSIFYYGYEFFNYCLFNGIEFSFSFDKTKSYSDKNKNNSG